MKNKTSYQQTIGGGTTDEWYTPNYITSALGQFDTDPCAATENSEHRIARVNFTKSDDGLVREWNGRVWLNPPYSRPEYEQFLERMCEHGNGIALLFNRQDTKIWQQRIAKTATSLLFLDGRVKFLKPDGTLKAGATCGSVLVAFGEENDKVLRECGLSGFYCKIR